MYFNPRPREEGDFFSIIFCVSSYSISIHALVKRATGWDGADKVNPSISIHALVKRATIGGIEQLLYTVISIHALVKRATTSQVCHFRQPLISIHALVKRATLSVKASSQISNYFNPRPREEGDKGVEQLHLQTFYFNPRPREEGDRVGMGLIRSTPQFQSTPS